MLGAGTFTAVVMATFKYTQGFRPPQHATEEDEYERRERIKRNRRRPIEETISELGEGRGELLLPHRNLGGSDFSSHRNLCPWLGREASGANQGEVWHRCHRCSTHPEHTCLNGFFFSCLDISHKTVLSQGQRQYLAFVCI